ncbi:MAG TPA: RIP metalloprotease RseP [Burkholderiaceae bacterium]|nr:RIP metalloprotease RseP [Burkholderiaceae bacterium]
MADVLTVIAFIVTLGILIVIHEFGHYYVARKCGVKVLRFSVGFGRPLWRRVAGADRTEWVIGAIPLGGYVRMLDERDTDVGPIAAHELPRAFNRQSVGKRIAIVVAGPLANLLLAVLVYWGLNVVGVMEPQAVVGPPVDESPAQRAGFAAGDVVVAVDGEQVRSFNELSWLLLQRAVDRASFDVVVERGDGTRTLVLDLRDLRPAEIEGNPLAVVGLRPFGGQPRIGRLSEGGAAQAAGLRSGDRVLEIDGQPIYSARELIERVRAAPGKALRFVVERDGERLAVTVTPAATREADGREIGRIGAEIGERPPLVNVRYGPLEGLGLAVQKTWDTALFSLRMLGKMIVGEASLKNLSGPVTIADYAGQTARIGPAAYLSFLALVSISLGVLNLLPIPLLDGGHLLYYAIEIIKGSPPAEWIVQWGQRAGIGLLFLLTALALYNDLTRLLF